MALQLSCCKDDPVSTKHLEGEQGQFDDVAHRQGDDEDLPSFLVNWLDRSWHEEALRSQWLGIPLCPCCVYDVGYVSHSCIYAL